MIELESTPTTRIEEVETRGDLSIFEVNPLADSLAILFKDALKGSDLASSMLPQATLPPSYAARRIFGSGSPSNERQRLIGKDSSRPSGQRIWKVSLPVNVS